jgi:RimJ/RimL family protein N-acetyltransferase
MSDFTVRPLQPRDLDGAVELFAKVAAERRWIATEPPVDRDARKRAFRESFLDDPPSGRMFVAVHGDGVIGAAGLRGAGLLDLGMQVDRGWRGRGVGSALLAACIDWARDASAYKITLQVWPHNDAALALYEKFGFEREGYLRKQWRRSTGELWDAILMGLVLEGDEDTAPARRGVAKAGRE